MAEMQRKVGELLRGKREEMSLSLKEVENATSIRMLYLQAIEEGRVQQLLSSVYALGFLRQYGTFLGIDMEKMAREYPEAFRTQGAQQEFAYGIGTMEARNVLQKRGRFFPNLLWGIGAVSVVLLAWGFGKWVGAF